MDRSLYIRMALEAARHYNLNPNIFYHQIAHESGFNPNAVSPAGAIGIAQFMPATAKGMGINPKDPRQALYGAARMMRGLVDQFGGNYSHALAAYNAGPGAVKKYKGMPPYRETRNYVSNILQAAHTRPFVKADAGPPLPPQPKASPVAVTPPTPYKAAPMPPPQLDDQISGNYLAQVPEYQQMQQTNPIGAQLVQSLAKFHPQMGIRDAIGYQTYLTPPESRSFAQTLTQFPGIFAGPVQDREGKLIPASLYNMQGNVLNQAKTSVNSLDHQLHFSDEYKLPGFSEYHPDSGLSGYSTDSLYSPFYPVGAGGWIGNTYQPEPRLHQPSLAEALPAIGWPAQPTMRNNPATESQATVSLIDGQLITPEQQALFYKLSGRSPD